MHTVWRLVTHHENREALLQWSKANGVISIGWSRIGAIDPLDSVEDITARVKRTYEAEGIPLPNWPFSGRQLHAFYHDMKVGDLVILSTRQRRCVMRITGDYYFSEGWIPNEDLYGHRRLAELTELNADEVWRSAGGMAIGDRVYNALLKCQGEI